MRPIIIWVVITGLLLFTVSVTYSSQEQSQNMLHLFATDLDGTLFETGDAYSLEQINALKTLKKWIAKENISIAYITGRNLKEVKDVIATYDLPTPNYIATDVGTRLYKIKKK